MASWYEGIDWGSVIGAGAALYGQSRSNDAYTSMQARQMRFQQQLAQHGIQWRAEDAKRAGLHPLAALGAPSAGGNPIHVGKDNNTPEYLNQMGQALGNVFNQKKKFSKTDQALLELQLNSAVLDNEYKRLRNVGMNQENINRASPRSDIVESIPKPVVKPIGPKYPGITGGARSLTQVFVDEFDRVTFELTQQASEPRESASGAKKGITNIYDAAMIAKVAKDRSLQKKLSLAATKALKQAGRLRKNHIVTFIPSLQIFKMVPLSGTKIKYGKPKRIDTGPNRNRKFLMLGP